MWVYYPSLLLFIIEETPIDICGDNSEVLMIKVISAHTNSFNRDSVDFNSDDADKLYIVGEEGGLVSAADAESACIVSVNGQIIDAMQASQLVWCNATARHSSTMCTTCSGQGYNEAD